MASIKFSKFSETKALIFDLMGTCCDWHSSLMPILSSCPNLPAAEALDYSKLATDWRAGFFKEIHARFEAQQPQEDIDTTHRRVLDQLLYEKNIAMEIWDDSVRQRLVDIWHQQQPWPEVYDALLRLSRKFFVVVLANGTTRLQLDIVQSSKLPFHMLFSSELLGLTKPDPAIYRKALQLLRLNPEQCIMVAAHAYDLRAANKVGIKTVYIQRTTEDLDENMSILRGEFDLFIDGTSKDEKLGLAELATVLGT